MAMPRRFHKQAKYITRGLIKSGFGFFFDCEKTSKRADRSGQNGLARDFP
jgi:hypothetical protein